MNLICKLFGHRHYVSEDDGCPVFCMRCDAVDQHGEDGAAYNSDAILIKPLIWSARRIEWAMRWPFQAYQRWQDRRRHDSEDVPF